MKQRFSTTLLVIPLAVLASPANGLAAADSAPQPVTSQQPSLRALACDSTNFTSAGSTTCTVTLAASAPRTGVKIELDSNSQAVRTPGTVTVPAGLKTAAFTVTVQPVSSNQTADVRASIGPASLGVRFTLSVPVSAAALSSLACANTSFTAAGSTTCTVNLSSRLSNDVTVALSSSSSLVTVPASLKVPRGYSSGAFTANILAFSGNQTVVVSASLAGVKKTVSLSLAATAPKTQNYSLEFGTYLGGSNWEHARDITTDAAGNIYLVGGTQSSNFKHTIGQAYAGSVDVFIAKLDPTGKLIWSELLGGPNYDRAYGVRLDKSGFVYITGRAGRGFPLKNAFQKTFSGYNTGSAYHEQNAFVAKLDGNGTVIWSSYVGTADLNRDLDVDANGDIYVASNYQPALGQVIFPSGWFGTAFQKRPPGGQDLVIIKIASDGSGVRWATYLGGSADENHKASIRLDPSGNIFVMTDTTSTNMPVPGGYQTVNRGPKDGYLAKLNPDGSGLLWATYFGGSGIEANETHHLAVDKNGNAYIAIATKSADAPTTPGAFQRSYAGTGVTNFHAIGDVLVAKFSPAGKLLASTYVGGADGDGPQGLAVDGNGNVYFSGGTVSPDFPMKGNAADSSKAGGEDAFAVRLKADFSGIDYSTYIGSSGNDEGRTLWADQAGNIYVGVEIVAGYMPLVKNVMQQNYGGGSADVFLLKLVPSN